MSSVRSSGRLIIAHRFIGGIMDRLSKQSVKRTADNCARLSSNFSRPFHGLSDLVLTYPTAEALGYFQTSAARTKPKDLTPKTGDLDQGLPNFR